MYGSAVYVYGESSPHFLGCEFVSNLGNAGHDNTSNGGAIYASHGDLPPQAATTTITECSFTDNFVNGLGAAVFSSGGGMHLTSNIFTRNWNLGGGTICFVDAGAYQVLDCVFDKNTTGAGIILADGAHGLIEGSTFARHSGIDIEGGEYGGSAISVLSFFPGASLSSVEIRRSLIAMNLGVPLSASPGSSIMISCTDIFGNGLGDWVGPIFGMDQMDGNLSLDPLFCGIEAGNLTLAEQSPCLPSNNSCGVLMGALEEGCSPVALKPESWGRIKAAYRNGDTPPPSPE